MPVTTKNARDIFLAASERPTPAERAAYLDEACAGTRIAADASAYPYIRT